MRLRPLAAAALVFFSIPVTAHAQEETPAAWIAPAYRAELLRPRVLSRAEELRVEASLTRAPDPLLSKGAKIAIIVCAIVVGVIIIFSVATIRPR